MDTAKIFWSGRSQAVRLPKAYRLATDEVRIRKHGNALILEPVADSWSWLEALQGQLDADASSAALEAVAPQARAKLDRLFR